MGDKIRGRQIGVARLGTALYLLVSATARLIVVAPQIRSHHQFELSDST